MDSELPLGVGALHPDFVYSRCELRRAGSSKEWDLVVDGKTVAKVNSKLAPDARFRGVARVRRSEVRFRDGFWLIRARAPDQLPTEMTLLGKRPANQHRIKDRTIELRARLFRRAGDSGESNEALLARVESFQYRHGVCVTNRGDRYELLGGSVVGLGKWRRGSAVLSLPRWVPVLPWVFIVREPAPLTVVLCHWHLARGDYRNESGGHGAA